jgi:hypothetical protein
MKLYRLIVQSFVCMQCARSWSLCAIPEEQRKHMILEWLFKFMPIGFKMTWSVCKPLHDFLSGNGAASFSLISHILCPTCMRTHVTSLFSCLSCAAITS